MAPGRDQGDQPPLMLNKDLDDGEHQTGGRLDRRRTGVQRRDEVPRVLEAGKGCTATKIGSGGSAQMHVYIILIFHCVIREGRTRRAAGTK